MSTTLRLTPHLKARIEALASRSGVSPHAFMLEAIEREVALAERRRDLTWDAVDRLRRLLETQEAQPAGEVHGTLRRRIAGEAVELPGARRWRK